MYMYIHVHVVMYLYVHGINMSLLCSDTYVPFCPILSRWVGFQTLGENVSILSHDICRLIRDHDPAHTIHYL